MENQFSKPLQRKATVTVCLLALAAITPTAEADLLLNFQPSTPNKYLIDNNGTPIAPDIQCMPGVMYSQSTCVRGDPAHPSSDPDTTPMFMERIIDNGVGYYHVMLGDPNSDFSQEYYIQFASTLATWSNGYQINASAGTYNGGADAKPKNNFTATFYDPLSATSTSGNGTGNPTRTIFNQTLQGTGFSQTVLKSSFSKKPKITQNINDAELSSDFVVDMSALDYQGPTALTAVGTMTNKMVVTDAQTGTVLTNFDINSTSQHSFVNGGQYQYNTGSWFGGSNGTYTYATGSYDISATNWGAFWDPNANIPNY